MDGISEDKIFKGNVNFFFGKNSAPNLSICSINLFILLLFRDLSPVNLRSMLGLVDKIPISNLANVPELPKFKIVFFFALNEPNPFPKTKNFLFFLIILTPSCLRHFKVENTSSDSKTFSTTEIFSLIAPKRKDLIDKDLSLSTTIRFLNLPIFLLERILKLL